MREIALRIWDDVHAQAGTKVEAQVTVSIGLDGNWTELDLTSGNREQLCKLLAPWLAAGRPLREPPAAPATSRKALGRGTSGLKIREWEHGRTYSRAIRAFADANGISYITPGGKWYYSRELRDAYAESIGMA